MDNPIFVDEENIPMVYQDDEDYGKYRMPDTNRV